MNRQTSLKNSLSNRKRVRKMSMKSNSMKMNTMKTSSIMNNCQRIAKEATISIRMNRRMSIATKCWRYSRVK